MVKNQILNCSIKVSMKKMKQIQSIKEEAENGLLNADL